MSVSGNIITRAKAREVSVTAVVIRADGTREDLGQIAYWHKNPLRRLAWNASKLFRRVFKSS